MEAHGLNGDNEALKTNNEEIPEYNHSPVSKPRLLAPAQQPGYDKYRPGETGMNDGKCTDAHIRQSVAEHTDQFLEQLRGGLDYKNPNATFCKT